VRQLPKQRVEFYELEFVEKLTRSLTQRNNKKQKKVDAKCAKDWAPCEDTIKLLNRKPLLIV
jgi:hypothetical protein